MKAEFALLTFYRDLLYGFEHEDFQTLDSLNEILKDGKSLARQFGIVLQTGNPGNQFAHYMRKFSKLVRALKVLALHTAFSSIYPSTGRRVYGDPRRYRRSSLDVHNRTQHCGSV